jgi:hypothetical protein
VAACLGDGTIPQVVLERFFQTWTDEGCAVTTATAAATTTTTMDVSSSSWTAQDDDSELEQVEMFNAYHTAWNGL